ncbi:unnamed protein product [Brassica oleracea var. botrytis]
MVQKTCIFGFLCKKHNSPINVKEEKKIAGEKEKSSKKIDLRRRHGY